MADVVEETVEESGCSRFVGAIKGVFFGIVLIGLACYLLYWNEERAYLRTITLETGQAETIEVDANKVLQENNEKLVMFKGLVKTAESLTDGEFENISVKDSLMLARNAEYYQWKETKHEKTEKKVGGGTKKTTTYSYATGWTSSPINSSSFKEPKGHTNTYLIDIQDSSSYVKSANIGEFNLNEDAIHSLGETKTLPLDSAMQINKDVACVKSVRNNYIYFSATNSGDPKVGDVRVSFTYRPCADATVIAQQIEGNNIQPKEYVSGKLQLNSNGLKTVEQMYEDAHKANSLMTWGLRAVGLILIYAGFMMIFKPISVMADIIPFFGNLAEMGLGLISGILTIMLGFTVIAIAWLAVRPWVAYTLLAIVGGLAVLAIMKFATSKKKAAPVTANAFEG